MWGYFTSSLKLRKICSIQSSEAQLGNGRVPAYSHNRLALDHFFATRPDSHSTISIIAWYLTLKNWNFSVYTRISTRNLTIFEPTRPDSTRPFDTRSDSYSTNLPLAHSLISPLKHFPFVIVREYSKATMVISSLSLIARYWL